METPVVGADEAFWYLSKPAGLPVFPARGRPDEPSLHNRFLDAQPDQRRDDWPEGFGAGLLHRLDTATSGLLIAARSPAEVALGREAFSAHQLRKTYRFLTARDVAWDRNEVDRPLAHDKRRKARMVWKRGQDTPHRGRWYPAVTRFRRVGRRGSLHLWEAVMSTGVMHQVRLHAASVGLPLAGDRLYGGGGDGRFFLHHLRVDGWPGDAPVVPLPQDWPA